MFRKRSLGGKINRQRKLKIDKRPAIMEQQNSLQQTGELGVMAIDYGNIEFEMRCVLYNLGAAHSRLAAAQDRSPPLVSSSTTVETESQSNASLKIACTHLQCAAWAFQVFFIIFYIYISIPN